MAYKKTRRMINTPFFPAEYKRIEMIARSGTGRSRGAVVRELAIESLAAREALKSPAPVEPSQEPQTH